MLVPHARFRWDEIRQVHQIVYPEGVLELNESGASIVRRCDGRTTAELIADLEQEVSDDNLATDIQTFLARLAEKGLLCDTAQ
jgi:pyrroloquinoline quinone biosynthesis protein D